MPHVAKKDIFSFAESVDLLIVFGHRGFNEMGVAWDEFRKRYPTVVAMGEPFTSSDGEPHEYAPGKFIATVAEADNYGMSDAELRYVFNRLIGWAHKNRIRTIVTNGIADITHGVGRAADRASDDRRAQMIIELAQGYENQFRLKITLVSIDDVFIR